MILTVTLNTSVDVAYVVPNFEPGMVYRASEMRATAGGKGLNVARVASLLTDMDVYATGFVGGYNGQYILNQLKSTRVISKFVEIPGESRRCINIIDPVSRRQTEILESGPEVPGEAIDAFIQNYTALIEYCEVIAISGSMPKGVPADMYARLVQIGKEKGKKVLLDTSGESLREGLKAKPYLIKPNIDEARDLLNMELDTFEARIEGIKKLKDYADVVVLSLGKDGALILHEGIIYHATTPDIKVVNTVGSGDSMIAGFAVGLCEKIDMQDIIRIAMAAGTANAMNEKTGYIDKKDYDMVLPLIGVETL